ncbi:MAG: lytic transglycosylase domain-containing protein, partial [Deltaproteobacteria bacterium]|nr:lytic transglycosylase domain-containing protein [Deltaproteobacteria bacterium]
LMQIMPSTGRFIAGKLGKDLNDARELLDPDTNIKLGSWYLGYLARRFEGDIVLTIASYNAGPNAVQRWTETLPTELDEFIESIPYPETRRYAKKVLKSYGEFLRTGGADPSGLLTRPALVLDLEERPAPGAGAEAVEGEEKS